MKPRILVAVGALVVSAALGTALTAVPAQGSPALPALVSTNPVNYTPNVIGAGCFSGTDPVLCRQILDIARIGNTVYAGGVVGDVRHANGAPAGTYGNAFTFDALTGLVRTDFRPVFTGASGQIHDGPVNAVERSTHGTAVWLGGEFKKLDGIGARGLVRWDVAGNRVYSAFQPKIGADGGASKVYDVKYFCGRLWVAGDFTSAGGVSRTALVSLDPTTGAATDLVDLGITGTAGASSGPTRVYKIAPSPSCGRVVIIGNFTKVSGQERHQVAVLNVSSAGKATLAPWYSPYHLRASQPGVGANPCSATTTPVWGRDVDWAPDGTWWALATTGGHHPYPTLCDSVSRWTNDDSTDARPVWINYSGGDTFHSVRVTGSHVYVGGHFKYLDHAVYRAGKKVYFGPGHQHYGLGALYATLTSGMAVPGWNDGTSTGRGAGWTAMLVTTGGAGTASGLWVGGDDENVSGETGKRIALLPLYP